MFFNKILNQQACKLIFCVFLFIKNYHLVLIYLSSEILNINRGMSFNISSKVLNF